MRIEEAAGLFFRYLELERGCSPCTSAAYSGDVQGLLRYLQAEGLEASVGVLTPTVLRRYVSGLSAAGYSPATIARRMYAISSLCKYLVNYGYAEGNPCAQVVLPRKVRRMPAVLTLEEARRVLKVSDDNRCPWMGFRNRAIIAALLFCGLRRQELVDLKLGDVDLRSRWLKVRRGKGGKGRAIPLAPEAAEAIRDWLEFRPEVDHEYLLTGLGGRRLQKGGLVRLFQGVAKRAGVDRRGVSLHTLRHTFASLLLQEGADLVSIQELLGHSDLSTTAIYLHLDAAHLQGALERHPLSA
ncbi:MAG TPA: tyrosine-type recombinase/integrase [Armatimonadota bacterium]|jgi:integrase/recombinase XerD